MLSGRIATGRLHRRGLTVLTVLFCARVAIAQSAQGTFPAFAPAAPPAVSYVRGQLSIDALDVTLAEVLARVAALTGVQIDVPPAASTERMPVVKFGPGPAREVLASLLNDSNVDYMIQASDSDSEKIQSVIVMAREKKSGKANGTEEMARASRSPYSRAARPSSPEEAPPPETSAPPQPDIAPPDASSSNPQPASPQPDQPPPPPTVEPAQPQQPGQLNGTRVGPQTVPQSLDSQSVSQTLQQMYQQRAQITQQEREAGLPPANPGK